MPREARKYLYDVQKAGQRIQAFSRDIDFEEYAEDDLRRSAVERQFEIIGEALNQLAKLDPDLAAGIDDYRRIIAFRNILIHGYADIDDRIVWGLIEASLPRLVQQVAGLLD